jgi:hypothetical protein
MDPHTFAEAVAALLGGLSGFLALFAASYYAEMREGWSKNKKRLFCFLCFCAVCIAGHFITGYIGMYAARIYMVFYQ